MAIPPARARPRLFIGSSTEGKDHARALQVLLAEVAQPTIWDQGVFPLGGDTLGSLLDQAGSVSFAAFLLTADDEIKTRGRAQASARDNLLFEAGIFLGALGRTRVFLLAPADIDLKLPSDLAGVTRGLWHTRDDGNLQAALGPCATEIREAIDALGPLKAPNTAGASDDLLRFARNGLDDLRTGAAGLGVRVSDPTRLPGWAENLLGMLLELFADRNVDDLYAAWLCPEDDSKQLDVAASRNLPSDYQHHPFRLGEGLAGQVWEKGVPAVTSKQQPHSWWALRKGCENQTYLCVPVGARAKRAGVLAVGSDAGFEVRDSDLQTLELFAGLLALAAIEPGGHDVQLLRELVKTLNSGLASRRGGEDPEGSTVVLYNQRLQKAKELRPEDEQLAALPPAVEGKTSVGGLRLLLDQLELMLRE